MSEDKARRKGLGRGLSALLGEDVPGGDSGPAPAVSADRGTAEVPVELLVSGRYQPRMDFDQEALQDLAESIRIKGIIQPILVRRLPEDPERYEIIAGERRWRAAQMAQRHLVPILVREFSDRECAEVALIENLQRRDLSPLEEAEGYRRLMEEFDRSQEELSHALGKSRSHVANMVRLLSLPDPVKMMLRDGRLTAGHARALLNADDPVGLAGQVVSKGLNVRQTEKLATEKGGVRGRKGASAHPAAASSHKDADTVALERDLSNLLGLKVSIDFQGRGGVLSIRYETLEQLDDILHRLNTQAASAAAEDAADGDVAVTVDPEADADYFSSGFLEAFRSRAYDEAEEEASPAVEIEGLDVDFDLEPGEIMAEAADSFALDAEEDEAEEDGNAPRRN